MIERCDFSDLPELFDNANEEKSGDQFARIGAESLLALERSQCTDHHRMDIWQGSLCESSCLRTSTYHFGSGYCPPIRCGSL
jgi:hypothetical protein